MIVPPALVFRLSLGETEVVAAQKMRLHRHESTGGGRGISPTEATIWDERNPTRSTFCSASFMVSHHTAGVRRLSHSIEGRRMIEKYGRIYGMCTGTSYKGCGEGYLVSRN